MIRRSAIGASIASILLLAAIFTAQAVSPPFPGGQSGSPYSYGSNNPPLPDSSQGAMYPPGSYSPSAPSGPYGPFNPSGPYRPETPLPDNQPQIPPSGSSSSDGGHPSSGPALMQPGSAPSASTGEVAQNLGDGQAVSEEQVSMIGGSLQGSGSASGQAAMGYALVGGLQQWALYNGQWTNGPSAVNYYGRMNIVVDNDQGQYIWSYEWYPNGAEEWKSWGYWWPGYHNTWFLGDMQGWHAIAVWGSQSGWSNVLWIYVW